jgi:hypothetical protein
MGLRQLLDLRDYLGCFSTARPAPGADPLPLHFLRQELLASAGHGAGIELQQLGQSLVAPAAQFQRFQPGIQTALALVQQAGEQHQGCL